MGVSTGCGHHRMGVSTGCGHLNKPGNLSSDAEGIKSGVYVVCKIVTKIITYNSTGLRKRFRKLDVNLGY